MAITLEDALRTMEEKAAMLRFMADAVTVTHHVPDPVAFNGVGDVCGEIEELARAAKRSLSGDVLCTELKRFQR